jgi:cell division protein FtsQ
LKALAIVVVVSVVVAGTFLVLHSEVLSARQITVRGAIHTSVLSIEQAAGLSPATPMIDVHPGAASARIDRLPWIATASLVRHWPDAVVITVTERTPVVVAALANGKDAFLDATGRVLTWGAPPPVGTFPVLTPSSTLPPGFTVPENLKSGLAAAAALPAVLRPEVRTVNVLGDQNVNLGLADGLTATLGPATQLAVKMEALASVLAGANLHGAQVIDVSVPEEPTVGPGPVPSA